MDDIVNQLRQPYNGLTPQYNQDLMLSAADEITRLRREVCVSEAIMRGQRAREAGMKDWFYSPKQIAKEYGWGCFKEDDNVD
jgi:hypothetical protein